MEMNVLEGYVTAVTRYAEFSGRSSRMEFFPIYLTSHLLLLIYFLVENYIEGFDVIAFIIQFLLIGSLIPMLAAQVRRCAGSMISTRKARPSTSLSFL